jgi:hypothetical protein
MDKEILRERIKQLEKTIIREREIIAECDQKIRVLKRRLIQGE